VIDTLLYAFIVTKICFALMEKEDRWGIKCFEILKTFLSLINYLII